MTFGFTNDPKLPAALRQRMQATQDARIAAGCTARDGTTYRTPERRAFADDLDTWKAAGKPEQGKADLMAREAELRAAGKF